MKRICTVLALLFAMSFAGSWFLMEAGNPAEPVGPVATTTAGYQSFEHFLAELAGVAEPGRAEALPPAPHTGCVGMSNFSAYLAGKDVYDACNAFLDDCPSWESLNYETDAGAIGYNLSGAGPECSFCIQQGSFEVADEGRASYQSCMTLSSFCSPSNPWC